MEETRISVVKPAGYDTSFIIFENGNNKISIVKPYATSKFIDDFNEFLYNEKPWEDDGFILTIKDNILCFDLDHVGECCVIESFTALIYFQFTDANKQELLEIISS